MSSFQPTVERTATELLVRLTSREASTQVGVDSVVDLTDFGDVVGVEVLDMKRQMGGGEIPDGSYAGYPRWAYDSEIDAYYLHLAAGRAQFQRKQSLQAALDADGGLVELRIPMST